MPYANIELRRKTTAAWRAANPDKVRAQQEKYNLKRDPEKRRDNLRRWRAANPERNRELNQLSDGRHPDRVKARRKAKYEKNREANQNAFAQIEELRLRALFAGAKSRAGKVGIAFNLAFEDIEWPQFCPMLGIRINYGLKGRRNRGDDSPSLDRTIPSLGYTKGNVVVLSWRANRIKYDSTIDEIEKLLVYLKKVRSH